MARFCKTCGTLYGNSLGTCPKCGTALLEQELEQRQQEGPPADRATVRRQWIGIVIGVPSFILFIYLIVYLFRAFAAR